MLIPIPGRYRSPTGEVLLGDMVRNGFEITDNDEETGECTDAKSSLGDAESSLGDAKSSLGDAKSSLGDANIS